MTRTGASCYHANRTDNKPPRKPASSANWTGRSAMQLDEYVILAIFGVIGIAAALIAFFRHDSTTDTGIDSSFDADGSCDGGDGGD